MPIIDRLLYHFLKKHNGGEKVLCFSPSGVAVASIPSDGVVEGPGVSDGEPTNQRLQEIKLFKIFKAEFRRPK